MRLTGAGGVKATRRRRLLVLAGGCVVVVIAAVLLLNSRGPAQAILAEQARLDGLAARDRGDYETAIDALMRWYRHQTPGSGRDVESLLALAHAQAQVPAENATHLREAITLYNEALRSEPGNVAALEAVAGLYERTGHRVEWMEAAQRILTIDTEHVEARRLMALGHYLDARFDDAAMHTAALMRLEPQELRWRELHMRVIRAGGAALDEMLAMCDVWIEEQREAEHGDGRFHMLKARLLLAAGQREAAHAEAQIAARLGADDERVLHMLTAMLDLLQLHEDAESLVETAAERHSEEAWPHAVAVQRLWRHGRIDEALQHIAHVERSGGELGPGLLRWKSLLLILRRDDEQARDALAAFEAAAARGTPAGRPDAADRAWIEACRARVQQHEMNWRESIAASRRAVALAPNDPVLHFLLAEAYAEVGDVELAAASLERAVHADPYWTSAQLLYADALLRLGRNRDAALLAADIVRRSPHPPVGAYLVLAHAWTATDLTAAQLGLAGETTAAQAGLIGFLETLLANSPEGDEAAALLVAATMRQGRSAIAYELMERMIGGVAPKKDDPHDAAPPTARLSEPAYVGLAALSEAHALGLEQRIVDRAVEEFGMSVALASVQARIWHRQGRTNEAIALFDQSIGDGRQRARGRAEFLAWAGHPGAVAALHQSLDGEAAGARSAGASPAAALFVLEQPLTWTDASLANRAIEALAKAAGESPRVKLARARYLATFEGHDPAAVAHAMMLVSEALNQSPNSIAGHRLMAELYMLGSSPNPSFAARHLRRAVESMPEESTAAPPARSAELYPDLIELLQHQGDFDSASSYLARMARFSQQRVNLHRRELRLLDAQGDYEAIVQRLNDRLDPLTACEYEMLVLASSLQRTGRHRQAERVIGELIDLSDDDAPSLAALAMAARFHASAGRFDEGLALLDGAYERDHTRSAQLAMLLGAYHEEFGSIDDAERWLRIAAETMPPRDRTVAEAWAHLAVHYLHRMNYAEARDAAMRGLALAPDHLGLGVLFFVSSANLDAGGLAEAMHWLDNTLGSTGDPELGIAAALASQRREGLLATLHLYARLAIRAQRAEPSARDLAEARELVQQHPWLLRTWRVAIAAHVEAGRTRDAVRFARAAAARFPSQHGPAEIAARLLVELGELDEALHAATMWRERTQHRPFAADVAIAAILLDLERGRAARRQLQPHEARLIAERHRSDDAAERFRLLLQTLAAAGEDDRVLSLLDVYARERDDWRETAAALSRLAPPASAARVLDWLERRSGDDAEHRLSLASHWLALAARSYNGSHIQRAASLAEEAVERGDDTVTALLLTAAAYELRGNLNRAAERYRRALELDDRNWPAMNNLALALLQSGADVEEAAALAARALDLAPDHPDVRATHALAQSHRRNADHAD